MMDVHNGSELCFPQLLNTSCRKPLTSWSESVFLHFLLSSVSTVTVTLNLLVIISVSHFRHSFTSRWKFHYIWKMFPQEITLNKYTKKVTLSPTVFLTFHSCILICFTVLFFSSRQLHKPTNLLLLSLSVSDFLVGLVSFPGVILRKTSCWFLGDFMCSLYKYITTVTLCCSVGNMVLISVDRYVTICDPLHYHTRVTVGRVKLWNFLCWFCSNLYSSLFVKNDSLPKYFSCYGKCVYHIDDALGFVDVVVSFIIPVTVIIILYMRVFVVAVTQARAMRSHITAVTLQHSVTLTSRKSELKAARTLGVLVAVFLLCFCPYYCVSLAGVSILKTSYGTFAICLYCFNSCLNPVIYALFYPWFRRAVKLIVTLQILQPGSREANVL